MSTHRQRELARKIIALLERPLSNKDELLELFCLLLGFQRVERPFSSTDKTLWGEGEAGRLARNCHCEILAQAGDAARGGFAVLYLEPPDFRHVAQHERALIQQLRQSFPDALYVLADPGTLHRGAPATVRIVHARQQVAATPNTAPRLVLRRFRIGRGERYRTTGEQLARLALDTAHPSAAEITALCDAAFNKEALTARFFREIQDHLRDLEKDQLDQTPDLDEKEAFTQAQLLLERLLFLYFAQNRGWLNQDAEWFKRAFAPYRERPDGFEFYRDQLLPLFRSLAKPHTFGQRLPGIPFLNGGLFDEDDFDSPRASLRVRNRTFLALFDNLLEAYNFTVREDTPLSQEVAVDPEMLGKVFESIVLHAESAGEEYQAPDKRKATGSYYTPRIVVHFICREALRLHFLHLRDELADPAARATWPARLDRLFREIDPTDGFTDDELRILRELLSPAEARRCLARLLCLRTLDPAVGSGAFPIGLLHELVALRRVFETVLAGYRDPVVARGAEWTREAKEHIIRDNLFGVDIQQQAIEICRLRLWLAILVDYELGVDPFAADRSAFLRALDGIAQLPNLEASFKRGDSLHDYLSGHPVRLDPQDVSHFQSVRDEIRTLGLKLYKAVRAETKRKLRVAILEKRFGLARAILDGELVQRQERISHLDNWFGRSPGDAQKLRALEAEAKALETARDQLVKDEAEFRRVKDRHLDKDFYRKLRRLEGAEMDGPLNFAWHLDFPDILGSGRPAVTLAGEMADVVNPAQAQQELVVAESAVGEPPPTAGTPGGFDLIVGNPPFVTARNPEQNELYRRRWPDVCHGKYLLICPFFARSFAGLLRPGGQLGFIVSNAFAKREFGRPLIEKFFPQVDLQKVIDCSGLMFPGHGTPTCIVFARPGPAPASESVRIAAILPGGGDLRTPPEESVLWHTLEREHDHPGFDNGRVATADVLRTKLAKWPWNLDPNAEKTKEQIERTISQTLRPLLAEDIGFDVIFGARELFDNPTTLWRRWQIPFSRLITFAEGESVRNYDLDSSRYCLFPYNPALKASLPQPVIVKLRPWKSVLSDRPQLGGMSQVEFGLEWYEFYRFTKRGQTPCLTFPEISTHAHFTPNFTPRVFTQKAPLIKLSDTHGPAHYHLLSGLLNSSTALFWLKQVCFSKRESEEGATDTYFEFAGNKVSQLPVPALVAEALRAKELPAAVAALARLAEETWQRGQELPSLALRKLFEKAGEAYTDWNRALPGWVAPHAESEKPFVTTAALRAQFGAAITRREVLRAEMIARQEEMDWLCYQAYGLVSDRDQVTGDKMEESDVTLARELRPFVLWAEAGGDFDTATALIPRDWSRIKKDLWRARLACIRDNEHIRRLEQPVYKRRWDEQWKVGNCWECGPIAYAAELVDAFAWWLSEKAEWHLEHELAGGPVEFDAWADDLWGDARIAAAWPLAADSIAQVEHHKLRLKAERDGEDPAEVAAPAPVATPAAWRRFLKETVDEQTVPAAIPPGRAWDDLARTSQYGLAELRKAEKVRGKLNVPRERFQLRAGRDYLWAGKG
jgi:type I restriction-modification system DNA methylase subunit